MELSEQLQDLLERAYQFIVELEERTHKSYKKYVFDHSELPSYQNNNFYFIDKELFFQQIIEILRGEHLMEENCIIEVRPMNAISEIWGFQFNFIDTENGCKRYSISLNSEDSLIYRFALIKELCQIYCDQKLSSARSHPKLPGIIKPAIMDELLEQMKNLNISLPFHLNRDKSGNNYTEFLAFFIAINMIFPKKNWANFIAITAQFKQGTINKEGYENCLKALSDCYQVPDSIIKFFDTLLLPYYISKGF